MDTDSARLETFDHVVVLMLENRSFDNLFGYLYRDGVPPDAPLGKTFEGVVGRDLSNPDKRGEPVPVSVGANPHYPYPDPGEEFAHVTRQLFDGGAVTDTPPMNGFVKDYRRTLRGLRKIRPRRKAWPGKPARHSKTIMQCFGPDSIPVLSRLATDFAVFDHWFCAVPSQTWCNRAFWHADTSWGWVNNPRLSLRRNWNIRQWMRASAGKTLFDLIEEKHGKGHWRIYEDLFIPFTKLIHWGDLEHKHGEEYFRYLEFEDGDRPNFFRDCERGELPKYSFLEPHFVDYLEHAHWHDDMHPSAWDSTIYEKTGPGTVLLGDKLVWKVYQAIRSSKLWSKTLLVITFDEHGGNYDHVAPPSAVSPDKKHFFGKKGQAGFDFRRLGVRVPMVMVSAHIAQNTVVDSPMHHSSFLATVRERWRLGSLGPRMESAPKFTEVFTLDTARSRESWPDWESYPADEPPLEVLTVHPREVPLNELQRSILGALRETHPEQTRGAPRPAEIATAADARDLLSRLGRTRSSESGR